MWSTGSCGETMRFQNQRKSPGNNSSTRVEASTNADKDSKFLDSQLPIPIVPTTPQDGRNPNKEKRKENDNFTSLGLRAQGQMETGSSSKSPDPRLRLSQQAQQKAHSEGRPLKAYRNTGPSPIPQKSYPEAQGQKDPAQEDQKSKGEDSTSTPVFSNCQLQCDHPSTNMTTDGQITRGDRKPTMQHHASTTTTTKNGVQPTPLFNGTSKLITNHEIRNRREASGGNTGQPLLSSTPSKGRPQPKPSDLWEQPMDIDTSVHRGPESIRTPNHRDTSGSHEPSGTDPALLSTLEPTPSLEWTKIASTQGYIFSSGREPTNTSTPGDLGKRKNTGYVKSKQHRNGSYSSNHDSPNHEGSHHRQNNSFKVRRVVSEMWIILLTKTLTKFIMEVSQPSILTGGMFKTILNPLKSMINVNLPQSPPPPLGKGKAVIVDKLQPQ
ncbi:hypothetical protein FXO38_28863 [Capsicum annuum]|nr:hypothetical protein FXO38_28863 [Capsicum annuum]